MKGIAFYDRDFFVMKSDHELIAESITRIIMTNRGERPGMPFFGVGLKSRVFEPMDTIIHQEISSNIKEQVAVFEPRAQISTLDFKNVEEENTLNVKIGFIVKGDKIEDERFINLIFELEN